MTDLTGLILRQAKVINILTIFLCVAGLGIGIWKNYFPAPAPEIHILSSEDLFAAVDLEKFHSDVTEFESAGSGSFSYVFQAKDLTPGRQQSYGVLRGIRPGQERTDLLSGLKKKGFTFSNNPRLLDLSTEEPYLSRQPSDPQGWSFSEGVFAALLFSSAMYFFPSRKSKALGLSKQAPGLSKHQHMFDERPTDRFCDIGGCSHIIEEMQDLKERISRVTAGEVGLKLPKGILLIGAPGCGKTLVARALAGETESPFHYVNSGAVVSGSYMGEWAKTLLNLFETARKARDAETERLRGKSGASGREQGVCILFLDEFDSIGSARMEESRHSDKEQANLVNALLAEMDNIDQTRNANILLVAATNNFDAIDSALKRPGRFAKILSFELPRTFDQRLDVLEKLAAKMILSGDFLFESPQCLSELAAITQGKSCDHLRGILEIARDLAEQAERKVITRIDIIEAFQRQDFGKITKHSIAPQKRLLIATHEHGHAILGLACRIQPFLVSMKPRGDTGGRVIPDANSAFDPPHTRNEIIRAMLLLAGGRAAEAVQFGFAGTSDGASEDLKRIRTFALHALKNALFGNHHSFFPNRLAEIPESYGPQIDYLVGRILQTAEDVVRIVGNEVLMNLVEDSLAIEGELIGENAQNFYRTRIPANVIEELQSVVDAFVESLSKQIGSLDNLQFGESSMRVAATI